MSSGGGSGISTGPLMGIPAGGGSGGFSSFPMPDFSSFFNSLNSYWSGMAIFGGEMKKDFVGDRLPKNGFLYPPTDSPWAPGGTTYETKFSRGLNLFKAESDVFSTSLELVGAVDDYYASKSDPTVVLMTVRLFSIDTINVWGYYLVTSYEDIIVNSPKQLDSANNINKDFKTDRKLWLDHLNSLKRKR